jgi:AP-3 complex subunit mu
MIHSVFFITRTGEVVIEKHYKGTTPRRLCDLFWEEVSKYKSPEDVPPVITTSKFYLFSILRNDLFVLANVSQDAPPLFVLEFLQRIHDVFESYFGTVDAAALKKHFSTVYQLLEELSDNGFPLITEPNALNSLIKPPSAAGRIMQFVAGKSTVSDTIGAAAMSVIPWRKTDVKYAQNEIFFDIAEELDCIIDTNGAIIKNDVRGTINARCNMSGTPDLTLIFNNPDIVTDSSFHPCVRYNRFERERVVSFVPPDGKFQLMRYRVPKAAHNSPLFLRPQIHYRDGSGKLTFTLGTKPLPSFSPTSFGRPGATAGAAAGAGTAAVPQPENIEVMFRLPAFVSAEWSSNFGDVAYNPTTNALTWTCSRMPKEKSPQLDGNVVLPPGPPSVDGLSAQLKFSVGGLTASGLGVKDLHLSGESYKYYKGVRSYLSAGRYVVRC